MCVFFVFGFFGFFFFFFCFFVFVLFLFFFPKSHFRNVKVFMFSYFESNFIEKFSLESVFFFFFFLILVTWLFLRKFFGRHLETGTFLNVPLLIYGCLRCIQIWCKLRTEIPTGKITVWHTSIICTVQSNPQFNLNVRSWMIPILIKRRTELNMFGKKKNDLVLWWVIKVHLHDLMIALISHTTKLQIWNWQS